LDTNPKPVLPYPDERLASGIATNINSMFLSFKASCLPQMPTRPPLPVEEPSILTRAAKLIE